jgi:hypothetical protein
MRIDRIVAWGCLLLAGQAVGQVPNDDCAGGFAQGVWQLVTWSTNCDDPGNSNNGTIIWDSTHLAVPNFPYPTNPSPCIGYTPTVAAPANDRWYAVQVGCELGFTVECSDTCHISFWSGDNCGLLAPLDCYTIPPNTPTTGMVWTLDNFPLSPDTLLVQISGNGVGQHTHYTLCLTNPTPPCDPIYVEPAPTPVTCFLYDITVMPASSSSSMDGAATVMMQMGNGPFSLVWATGDTTLTLAGLPTGWHAFTITDAQGCHATDSVLVPVDATVGMSWPVPEALCGIQYDAVTHGLVFGPDFPQAAVVVMDATGRTVWVNSQPDTPSHILLPQLAPGLHVVRSSTPDGLVCILKFVTHY